MLTSDMSSCQVEFFPEKVRKVLTDFGISLENFPINFYRYFLLDRHELRTPPSFSYTKIISFEYFAQTSR